MRRGGVAEEAECPAVNESGSRLRLGGLLRPLLSLALPTPKVALFIASPSPLGDDPTKWDPAECDALLRGGEQVTSLLQEMLTLVQYFITSLLNFLDFV
ncbi:hypothetical protein ZWY2020_046635 [Hordeum vulgare]|nr:hypothetical protein ZWY2020_046635 [Hordeum vulgare]